MTQKALGMVETYGMVAAIEAADVALKTAAVELVNCEIVKGGRIMIALYGEVAAVQASVTAGAAAAAKINTVFSQHVIPRPLADPRLLINHNDSDDGSDGPDGDDNGPTGSDPGPDSNSDGEAEQSGPQEQLSKGDIALDEKAEIDSSVAIADIPEEKESNMEKSEQDDESELANLSVPKLRDLARNTEGIAIKGRQISKANKKTLIQEILRAKNNK